MVKAKHSFIIFASLTVASLTWANNQKDYEITRTGLENVRPPDTLLPRMVLDLEVRNVRYGQHSQHPVMPERLARLGYQTIPLDYGSPEFTQIESAYIAMTKNFPRLRAFLASWSATRKALQLKLGVSQATAQELAQLIAPSLNLINLQVSEQSIQRKYVLAIGPDAGVEAWTDLDGTTYFFGREVFATPAKLASILAHELFILLTEPLARREQPQISDHSTGHPEGCQLDFRTSSPQLLMITKLAAVERLEAHMSNPELNLHKHWTTWAHVEFLCNQRLRELSQDPANFAFLNLERPWIPSVRRTCTLDEELKEIEARGLCGFVTSGRGYFFSGLGGPKGRGNGAHRPGLKN